MRGHFHEEVNPGEYYKEEQEDAILRVDRIKNDPFRSVLPILCCTVSDKDRVLNTIEANAISCDHYKKISLQEVYEEGRIEILSPKDIAKCRMSLVNVKNN